MKQFWLNLPVKDINKSKAFFTHLGFRFNEQHSGPDSLCMLMGEHGVVVMLFGEAAFQGFVQNAIARQSSEVLLSIDAQSKEEVDEMVRKALEAGGSSDHKPHDMQGPMYGCVFADLDGHRWNVLYMDTTRMNPQ